LTSTYDVLAFYRAVALLPDWQPGKRNFMVLGGGFGMQNPIPIRGFLDYAFFGRAEDCIAEIVGEILGGGFPSHPSVMHLPDIHPVMVRQAQALYPAKFKLNGRGDREWHETFIGCPNKCRFCHYTWARKHIGVPGEYIQASLTTGNNPEVLWRDIPSLRAKPGRLRTAIDGFSERLRCSFGKKIKRYEIASGIEALGRFDGTTVVIAYNIANMPTETESDREELYSDIRSANPRSRIVFVLHSTPFRPSPLTPMSHVPASLEPCWHRKIGKLAIICDRPNLLAMHSRQMESPKSHLETLIIERATPESDRLFHAICFAAKLHSVGAAEWLRLVRGNFDIMPYIRGYAPEEQIPTWFLSGWCMEMDKAVRWVDRQCQAS
jgi:hypothetical protein